MNGEARMGRRATLVSLVAAVVIGVASVAWWSRTAGAHTAPARTASAGAPRQDAAAHAGDTPTGQTGGLIHMTEGGLEMVMTPLSDQAPTWAEIQRVYHIVSIAAATAKYKELAVARRAGYVTAPDLFVESQGQHYVNPRYLAAVSRGTFDPAHPPFLVYNTMHGRPTLSGLMFYLPASLTPRQLARIFPASLANWHQHVNVCVGGGTSPLLNGTSILHDYDAQSCAAHGGHFVGNTGWIVHTWIGQANGTSLFAMDMNTPASSSRSGMPGMGSMLGMAMPTPAPTQRH